MRASWLIAIGCWGALLACGDDPDGSTVGAGGGATATTTASGGSGTTTTTTGGGGQGGAAVPANRFVYVASRGSDRIEIFSRRADGTLVDAGQADAAEPAPLAISPDKRFLYAGLLGNDSVEAFVIDPQTGLLSEVGTYDVGIRPVYLSVDPSGANLLVASYANDAVRVFRRQNDGSIALPAQDEASPGTNPHAIITDPTGAFVFVPNTNSDTISQFTFDPVAGTLTPNAPPMVNVTGTVPDIGPRHLVFHPDLPRLYVVNEHDDSVTVWDVSMGGALSERQTLPTLSPGDDKDNNTCADIHITPDGAFLYASNRGDNSLARYAVDATTGELTSLGEQATETFPREFEISPDGRFIYVAGQASGLLAAYRIQPDGSLFPIGQPYAVGDSPQWVIAVDIPIE